MTVDQAEALRVLAGMSRLRQEGCISEPDGRRTQVIAVSSGKGGVGKTAIVANLAVALAEIGRRTVVFDADLGLANVDLLFGVNPPYTLGHVVRGERALADTIAMVGKDVMLIAGGSGLRDLAELPRLRRQELISSLRHLEVGADFVLIDTAAGVSSDVLEFVTFADRVLVVTSPEPPALTDAYALVKLALQEGQTRFSLLVNMVKGAGEASSAARTLMSVSRRFLGLEVEYVGSIPVDPSVSKSIRQQQPFVLACPGSPATVAIVAIRDALLPGDTPAAGGALAGVLRRIVGRER